jgi:hypothetical protein
MQAQSLVGLGAILVAGCGTMSYDHSEKIATATLFSANGSVDERAFSGALLEKISSANSPPQALLSFVESLGGKCSSLLLNSMSCSIPHSGEFCIARRIIINAVVANGVISSLRTSSRNDGC